MSKIGRQAISLKDVEVTLDGQIVSYKGKNRSGEHVLPNCLKANIEAGMLKLDLVQARDKKNYKFWGLHRALLANQIHGAREEFVETVVIVGLGYKGELKGDSILFSLGYSHKIDFKIPKTVTVTIDKTGQLLVLKSADKFLVGDVAQKICALRKTEPYKGTGIHLQGETVFRKVGKN